MKEERRPGRDHRKDRGRPPRVCAVPGCARRAWASRECSVCAKQRRRSAGGRESGDGGRVVYMHPSGVAMFGVVPEANRCRGCRTWATHEFHGGVSHIRGGRPRTRGWVACLPCIDFWQKLGRSGTVKPITGAA